MLTVPWGPICGPTEVTVSAYPEGSKSLVKRFPLTIAPLGVPLSITEAVSL
jgi:hypothetical protein